MAEAPSSVQEQQDHISLKGFARRIFLVATTLQSLLFLVNGTIFFFFDFHLGIISTDWTLGDHPDSFWEFLLDKWRIETVAAYALGSMIFCLGAYLIGGIAPYALIEKNRSLIAVAARTMLLPSLLAAFGMFVSFLLIRIMHPDVFQWRGDELSQVFLLVVAFYYIPALITATLAALLVRQRAIARQERSGQVMRQDASADLPSPI
jgi:hypothetical protein